MSRKNVFFSALWIVLGTVLFLCGIFEVVDSYWSGMGGAFLAVGILQALRIRRYYANPDYREKFDRANKDERNRFLGGKAWAWAGYLFVMTAAIGSIVFKLMGREDLMQLASGGVCLILIYYWLAYLYLSRKY